MLQMWIKITICQAFSWWITKFLISALFSARGFKNCMNYLLWLVDVNQGANFGSCEWNVLVSNDNLQFLWKTGQNRFIEKKKCVNAEIIVEINIGGQKYFGCHKPVCRLCPEAATVHHLPLWSRCRQWSSSAPPSHSCVRTPGSGHTELHFVQVQSCTLHVCCF